MTNSRELRALNARIESIFHLTLRHLGGPQTFSLRYLYAEIKPFSLRNGDFISALVDAFS